MDKRRDTESTYPWRSLRYAALLSMIMWALMWGAYLLLTGCGGGGDAAVAAAVAPVTPLSTCDTQGDCSTCPSGETLNAQKQCIPTPPPTVIICSIGGDPDNNGCTCPAGTAVYGSSPPLCLAPCPAGDTGTPGNCGCPAGYSGFPPTCVSITCPINEYGTPPNCLPDGGACPVGTTAGPLSCTCPAADLDADNGSCIVPQPVTTSPSSNFSFTTPPNVSIQSGTPTLTWSAQDTTSNPSTYSISCSVVWNTTPLNATTDPYPGADAINVSTAYGRNTYVVTCIENISGVLGTPIVGTATLQVGDSFSWTTDATNDGGYTFTWTSQQPGYLCSVQAADQINATLDYTLSPGGSASGTATSAPVTDPTTFTLVCNGAADAYAQPNYVVFP